MRTWSLCGAAVLCAGVLGCPAPPSAKEDAGQTSEDGGQMGSDGGSDAGGEAGRFVDSDDGVASLWIPAGAAPASTQVTISAVDAGVYRLSPDGLQFAPPALLMLRTSVMSGADGGIKTLRAALISSDGGVERARTAKLGAVKKDGIREALDLVRVPHFTNLLLGASTEGTPVGDFPYVEVFPDFGQGVGRGPSLFWHDRLNGKIVFKHVSPGGFVPSLPGTYELQVSGAMVAELPAAGPQPLPGSVTAEGSVATRLYCQSIGQASIRLIVKSPLYENDLAVQYDGICIGSGFVMQLDPAAVPPDPPVPPNGPVAVLQELAQTAVKAPTTSPQASAGVVLPEGLDSGELAGLAQHLGNEDLRLEVKLQLQCTRCELNVPKAGAMQVKNLTTRSINLTEQFGIALSEGVLGVGDLPLNSTERTYKLPISVPLAPGASTQVQFAYRCLKGGNGSLESILSYALQNDDLYNFHDYDLFGLSKEPDPLVQRAIDENGRHQIPIFCDEQIKGDAILLSDNAKVTRGATSWTVAAPGVSANFIQAHTDVDARFYPLAPSALLYGGVTVFKSNSGLTPVTLKSSVQTATATFNGTRYALTGLVAQPAFAASDSLIVSHTSGASVTVAAPPPLANINAMFGAPAGWSTQVSIPDGTFDTLYVFAALKPASNPAGEFGLMRFVKAADMTLTGGNRVGPLLDDEARAQVGRLGWSVLSVYVAYLNTAQTTAFFPSSRQVPVQAGRMFQLTPAELGL